MSFPLNGSITPLNPMADIDIRKRPFSTLQQLKDATAGTREIGLEGKVIQGGVSVTYILKAGIGDSDWVLKDSFVASQISNFDTAVRSQKTLSAQEQSTLGAELANGTGWTSTGWTGSFASGFLHTTGNTSNLTFPFAPTVNQAYQVEFEVSGLSAGSVSIIFGGVTDTKVVDFNRIFKFAPRAVTTGILTIVPSSDFNGTVKNITIKHIDAGIPSIYSIIDSSDLLGLETRTGAATKNNTLLGRGSGNILTSGYDNVGVGPDCLLDLTSGFENVGIGSGVLVKNSVGHNNMGAGFHALFANISGRNNVGIGTYSLTSNTTGDQNTAIGTHSLNDNVSGSENVAVGEFSLFNCIDAVGNVAVGCQALAANISAPGNTAVGFFALQQALGSNNTALGSSALSGCTTGIENTAIGQGAGSSITTGRSNILIGESLDPITDGSYNVIIGRAVSLPSGTNNNVVLADGAGNIRLRVDQNGLMGVGNITTPTARVHIQAGVAGAGGASLKIDEGALLPTAEKGAFEFVAGVLYFSTANGTRKTVTLV